MDDAGDDAGTQYAGQSEFAGQGMATGRTKGEKFRLVALSLDVENVSK